MKSIYNGELKMSEKGQSLLELVVAIGIFVIVVSGLAFFILNSYISGRLSYEFIKANFLAEEGIEAVISIRDNGWEDLTTGDHGLTIFDGHWVFQGTEEGLSGQLNNGKRIIKIEDIDTDRKKIISTVTWQFSEGRAEEIRLATYLTNWQKITIYCQGICTPCSDLEDRKSCNNQDGCSWRGGKGGACIGICTPCEGFLDQASCEVQVGCIWTGP